MSGEFNALKSQLNSEEIWSEIRDRRPYVTSHRGGDKRVGGGKGVLRRGSDFVTTIDPFVELLPTNKR